MTRILVKASSSIAKAGLESLLRTHPGFEVVADPLSSRGRSEAAWETPPAVLVAEAETLADPSAREALDWAAAGGRSCWCGIRPPKPLRKRCGWG